jgi:hypothetical protein
LLHHHLHFLKSSIIKRLLLTGMPFVDQGDFFAGKLIVGPSEHLGDGLALIRVFGEYPLAAGLDELKLLHLVILELKECLFDDIVHILLVGGHRFDIVPVQFDSHFVEIAGVVKIVLMRLHGM